MKELAEYLSLSLSMNFRQKTLELNYMSPEQRMYMLASRLNQQMIVRASVAPLKRPQGQGGPHRSCIEMRAQQRMHVILRALVAVPPWMHCSKHH